MANLGYARRALESRFAQVLHCASMIVDVHCHYALARRAPRSPQRFSFEPVHVREKSPSRLSRVAAETPRPTDYDTCLSARALHRWNWRIARALFRVPKRDADLDPWLEREFARHLFAPGPIERFVLLAFDAVLDDEGQCVPLPRPGDRFGSDLYSSNSFIRDLCRRHPERFLFGASVHPYRSNAVACVEEVFAAGACLLKWMPQHHNINPADPRTRAVLRACARLGLPVLVHVGEEFTLTTQRPAYAPLRPFLEVLRELRRDGVMPITIVAHAATPVLPWGDRHSHRDLLTALAGEFAHAPLYADISALTTLAKSGFLCNLLRRPELHHKLLFGTDFPVPPQLHRLRRSLGRDYRAINAEPSWPQRAARALRLLGLPEIVFHRAAELLPNVHFFRASHSAG
jgi:hypothetical protein